MLVTEADGVCHGEDIGVFGEDLIAPVMVEGGSKVNPFGGTEVPGSAVVYDRHPVGPMGV